jgi:Ca2+-binding RTX toxin-like protein
MGGSGSTSATGADQLFGLGGNDVIETQADNCQLFGGDGDDTLTSGGFNAIIEGGNGNDILTPGAGSCDLYGGAGRDVLYAGNFGGAGPNLHKIFHYQSISNSGVTAATRDVIYDFQANSIAKIDLSAIDAVPGTKGVDEDFNFIGAGPWGHHAGDLRYLFTADHTIVEADVNGDAKADFSIALDGHHTLSATEFIL